MRLGQCILYTSTGCVTAYTFLSLCWGEWQEVRLYAPLAVVAWALVAIDLKWGKR